MNKKLFFEKKKYSLEKLSFLKIRNIFLFFLLLFFNNYIFGHIGHHNLIQNGGFFPQDIKLHVQDLVELALPWKQYPSGTDLWIEAETCEETGTPAAGLLPDWNNYFPTGLTATGLGCQWAGGTMGDGFAQQLVHATLPRHEYELSFSYYYSTPRETARGEIFDASCYFRVELAIDDDSADETFTIHSGLPLARDRRASEGWREVSHTFYAPPTIEQGFITFSVDQDDDNPNTSYIGIDNIRLEPTGRVYPTLSNPTAGERLKIIISAVIGFGFGLGVMYVATRPRPV